MAVQRSDLTALQKEIDRLWEQNRQLRERIARTWEQGVPDGVAVYNSSNISTSNGVTTALTFDSERRDDAGFHSTSSNTERLTVPAGKAGWYIISGHIFFEGNSGGTYRRLLLRVNGSTYIAGVSSAPQGSANIYLTVSTEYPLAAGDYVELTVRQDSGGSLNVLTGAQYTPEFRMVRVI